MKLNKSSVDVFSQDTLKFVQKHLTSNNVRILEVGCGAGDFSYELMKTGAQLTACDTNEKAVLSCKDKGVSAIHADFLSIKGELFDVILFTRSLHHIHKLKEAIEHSNSLLVLDGMIIIEDFDLNMIDTNTARWYYDIRSIVSVCTNNKKPSEFVKDPIQTWIDDHNHTPPLNSGDEMIKTVQDRFDIVSIERNPYLYRSICGRLNSFNDSYRITAKILEIESGLISEQDILPTGLRIVGKKSTLSNNV